MQRSLQFNLLFLTESEPQMSTWNKAYETQLLTRAATGDRAAFSEIYDRFSNPLFSLALKILGNRNDAEEVIQDVFCSVWKKAGTFDSSRAGLFTWMTAMTRNRCIDRLRARGSRIATSENFPAEDNVRLPKREVEAGPEESAVARLMRKEEANELLNALLELPGEQKDVLELAFLSGWTHSEIAERRDLSLGTVKARIRYGLEKLRNRYASS